MEGFGTVFRVRAGRVFTASHVLDATTDVWIGGEKIARVCDASNENNPTSSDWPVLDWSKYWVVPGLIDSHCHLTGGGGELGFRSRCPESRLGEFVSAGVTTVVGVLGTDGITRSLENLLAKARSLNSDGITAYMYTGNYHFPVVTLTGSVTRDLVLINEVLGVGELAVGDHRGSAISAAELSRVLGESYIGGMLSEKAGVVHLHMGSSLDGFRLLNEVADSSEVPISKLIPTHCSRKNIVEPAIQWAERGGWIDLSGLVQESNIMIKRIFESKPELLSRVTVSSDAYGSLPSFNDKNEVIGYTYMKPDVLSSQLAELVLTYNLPLEKIIPLFTSNHARALKLPHKGQIEEGFDADLVALDPQSLKVVGVISRGKVLKHGDFLKQEMFEKSL